MLTTPIQDDNKERINRKKGYLLFKNLYTAQYEHIMTLNKCGFPSVGQFDENLGQHLIVFRGIQDFNYQSK